MADRLFCGHVMRDAQAVVDGVADERAQARFSAHCLECPACRAAARELLLLRRAASELAPPPLPRSFDEALRARLVAQYGGCLPSPWWVAWCRPRRLAPLIALCGSLILGYAFVRSQFPGAASRGTPMANAAAMQTIERIYESYLGQTSSDPFADRARVDVSMGIALARSGLGLR